MPYTIETDTANRLSEADRIERLTPPDGEVEIVLDTDTNAEIDDQFALGYAWLSESLDVEAVYAAPFHNPARTDGPGEGMEQSYDEIIHVLDLLEVPDPATVTYRGAIEYMEAAGDPVESSATDDLIQRARDRDSETPLYVVAIGAPTNIASAIELAPEIVEDIVVVWLGGHPLSWYSAREFNLQQDIRASRILFDSGIPLVQIPCKNVAEHVRTTELELNHHLADNGPLSEYLLDIFTGYERNPDDESPWSKEIWDLAPIAYLLDHQWVPTTLDHSPHLSEDCQYGHDSTRHLIRVARDARRDYILEDFFEKLADR